MSYGRGGVRVYAFSALTMETDDQLHTAKAFTLTYFVTDNRLGTSKDAVKI
jgi:hypothetical protein